MTSAPFCYVILAHTDNPGLLRLVARIRELSPRAGIIVRHEEPALIGSSDLRPYDAIDLVSRIKVRWGSWTMVPAMLEAFANACQIASPDYVTLISGQDYPIRDLASWESEFSETGADVLLDPMEAQQIAFARHFMTFELPGPRTVVKRAVHWNMDRLGRITQPRIQLYRMARTGPDRWWFSVPRRRGERPEWFFKASQWMTVRRDLLEQMLQIAGPRGRGLRHMRTMLVPDEIALQSTAMQLATHASLGPTSAMRFAPESPSPDWLTARLVNELATTTSAPFARKVPVAGWEEVIEAADRAASADRSAVKSAGASRIDEALIANRSPLFGVRKQIGER